MEEEISTDAIGIPPRSVPEGMSIQDGTSKTLDPSKSDITFTTPESGCSQTNTQSQLKTLEKPFQSENTHMIKNEANIDPSNDFPTYIYDRNPNISSARDSRDDHPIMSDKNVVNAELTAQKRVCPSPEEITDSHDKNEGHQSSNNLQLPPEPPLEWRLNELLDDIAMEIDGSEFKRIKLLFTGPESLGEDLLNECDTCIKLFTVLKEKKYISRDNILYLNKILYILGRRDLIKRSVEYCLEEGNVIHYYSFEGDPGSRRRYVKIHVVADVQNYNKETLDQLRNCVASIVCAPIEVVVISAVEPGSSFVITFTMPEIYVDVLKDLLQQKVNLWRLSSLQVDIIIVDDIPYDISGLTSEKMVNEQYMEIRNVYEQLNDKRKELEQLEITHLQRIEEQHNLKLQLERTENENHELKTTCSMLQKLHLTFNVTDAALGDFQSLIKEATDKGQDMGLLQKIIKSNTEITAAYHRSVNEMKRKGHTLKLKERKTSEQMLLRELSLNLKSAEEILHTKYSHHTLDFNLGLNLDITKTLYETSKTLKDEEREELMNSVIWDKDDVVKACIEADKGLLLLGLECKKAEQTQNKVNTGTFLILIGKVIGKDLLKLNRQIAEHKRKQDEEDTRKELNLQLLKQLTLKSKSPEEIVLSYANSFSFRCIITTEEESMAVSAAFFVEKMTLKGKGLIIFLNEDECTKMLSFCTWYEQDVIKECIKEDRRLLLPGVLCKEMERVGGIIIPEGVIMRLQEETKRKDLLGLFYQLNPDEKELQLQINLWHKRQQNESQLLEMLSSCQNSAEEVLLQKFKQFTLKLAADINTKPSFKKLTKLLGDLSGKVNTMELAKLIDLYEWDEKDIIKACISADRRLLFEGLWCKDIEITQMMTPLDSYLSSICQKIKRTDLFDQYKEEIKLLSIDEKLLHHMIDKTAEYVFNAPNVQNMLNNIQTMTDEAGATSIPRYSTSLIKKAASTSSEYLPM